MVGSGGHAPGCVSAALQLTLGWFTHELEAAVTLPRLRPWFGNQSVAGSSVRLTDKMG